MEKKKKSKNPAESLRGWETRRKMVPLEGEQAFGKGKPSDFKFESVSSRCWESHSIGKKHVI